jgi:hypothetical protein
MIKISKPNIRMNELTITDFAHLFGTTPEDVREKCGSIIDGLDFRYQKLKQEERDQLILKVLKRIDSDNMPAAGWHRKSDWEHGWQENLEEFVASGFDLSKLIPKYYKKNVPARFNGDFIFPVGPEFVYNVTYVFTTWLFKKYFYNIDSIYEFGCGPGHNLVNLASIYPEKRLYGLDWSTSSQEIIALLQKKFGWKIKSYNFDFFNPDENIYLDENSGVFTFGALEQLGSGYGKFLNFLIERMPTICVNVEGLKELYNENNLFDYIALKYHTKRAYLNSYLSELRKLKAQGRIEIIKIYHRKFGNIYDDPHSYVVWKPKS